MSDLDLLVLGISLVLAVLGLPTIGIVGGIWLERRRARKRRAGLLKKLRKNKPRAMPEGWYEDVHPGCIGIGCRSRLHSDYAPKVRT